LAGDVMRLQKKSLSKINLTDLLRRKRSTLEKFLKETGIVTYNLLVKRCDSIGVVPPTEDHFLRVKGNPVTHEFSSPTEGIVVINPPPEDEMQSSVESDVADSREDTAPKKRKKSSSATPQTE
jgi:hypothetical protein